MLVSLTLQCTTDAGSGAVVYGYSDTRPKVELQITPPTASIGGLTFDVASGRWEIEVLAEAGGPYVMIASANGVQNTIKDVYFGDVFLCSGQSNVGIIKTLMFTNVKTHNPIVVVSPDGIPSTRHR